MSVGIRMKLAIISDTHGMHEQCPEDILDGCDVLIHCGDFCNHGYLKDLNDFADWLRYIQRLNLVKHIVIVAGNHDTCLEDNPTEARKLIPLGVHYLEDESLELMGYKFYGSPQQPAFCNWAFNRQRGLELNEYWKEIPSDTDILITHSPPRGIMDISVYSWEECGCDDLLNHVENRVEPLVHCFGHIHKWTGTEKRGNTTFVNASQVSEEYIYNKEPIILELPEK